LEDAATSSSSSLEAARIEAAAVRQQPPKEIDFLRRGKLFRTSDPERTAAMVIAASKAKAKTISAK
jgi:hypothetical protein